MNKEIYDKSISFIFSLELHPKHDALSSAQSPRNKFQKKRGTAKDSSDDGSPSS